MCSLTNVTEDGWKLGGTGRSVGVADGWVAEGDGLGDWMGVDFPVGDWLCVFVVGPPSAAYWALDGGWVT